MNAKVIEDWLLLASERGNTATRIDARHPGDVAWASGCRARPFLHGADYFAELYERMQAMGEGDSLYFTDWRGDPDERLLGRPGTEISTVLERAARRGVDVRGLIWRSHWDRFGYSGDEALHLGEEIEDAGGECLRDMRVTSGGSHHQKFVVLRHADDPSRDVAYVGGIVGLSALGLLEWPIALVIAGGHVLAADRGSRTVQELGEAMTVG